MISECPLTPPSPQRGEGGVRGHSEIVMGGEEDEPDGVG